MKLKRFQRNRRKPNIIGSLVTPDDLIRFGWAFGFSLENTMNSLQDRGFLVSKQEILETWVQLDELMESA